MDLDEDEFESDYEPSEESPETDDSADIGSLGVEDSDEPETLVAEKEKESYLYTQLGWPDSWQREEFLEAWARAEARIDSEDNDRRTP